MVRMQGLMLALLVLAGGALRPGTAAAGPILDWFCCCPCPPPCYSPFRYWTPTGARVYDCLCGPHIPVFPPDRHPEIPPSYVILDYPCPPAPPEATLIPVPTAPPTSKFQYFEQVGQSSGSSASNGSQSGGSGMSSGSQYR